MMTHGIGSARYAQPEPANGYALDVPVIVHHAVYGEQSRRANDDNDGGGMLAYLAAGGVIDPYVLRSMSKEEAASRIDADAEAVRLCYITPGAGMAMTYQEKFAQAAAVQSMGEEAASALSPEDRQAQFPTLSASVGIEAPTLFACAELVLRKYAEFAQLSGLIERTRLAAKKAISDASDAAGVRAAYEAITWPTP